MSDNIAILGAGSWGITLSMLLSEKGHKINLWESNEKQAEILKTTRTFKFLPNWQIPDTIMISSDPKELISEANMIIFAVPSQVVRDVTKRIVPLIKNKDVIIVVASKGIEADSSLRMSEIISSQIPPELREKVTVLSGPTIAVEVIKKNPTVAVIAASSQDVAEHIQQNFMTPYFRLYTSSDIIGVELGGALKNIIAIAAGINDGLGLGTNAKAALMTRGIVEITRLGIIMGAKAETFSGLSGIGDLITTCISRYSRNRTFGEKIGQGKGLREAVDEIGMVVEGIKTAEGVYKLSLNHKIAMPITTEIYNILFNGKNPKKAVEDLMMRQARPEIENW